MEARGVINERSPQSRVSPSPSAQCWYVLLLRQSKSRPGRERFVFSNRNRVNEFFLHKRMKLKRLQVLLLKCFSLNCKWISAKWWIYRNIYGGREGNRWICVQIEPKWKVNNYFNIYNPFLDMWIKSQYQPVIVCQIWTSQCQKIKKVIRVEFIVTNWRFIGGVLQEI